MQPVDMGDTRLARAGVTRAPGRPLPTWRILPAEPGEIRIRSATLTPECLNRTRQRKSVKPGISLVRPVSSQFLRGKFQSSRPPAGKPALEAHDVADDFGDRMIVLDRD